MAGERRLERERGVWVWGYIQRYDRRRARNGENQGAGGGEGGECECQGVEFRCRGEGLKVRDGAGGDAVDGDGAVCGGCSEDFG